ncbi:MAG: hypothetical protein QT11_C0001G0777 [archaeon GW2011_AR20]|nr:MAG: hypothetical protein QT11_C0001G0777 [archaeon GW2011_AR20]
MEIYSILGINNYKNKRFKYLNILNVINIIYGGKQNGKYYVSCSRRIKERDG